MARRPGPLFATWVCNPKISSFFGASGVAGRLKTIARVWSKSFGKKAGAIVKAWVENTAIYSILEQVVSQEGLKHCFNIDGKHCNLQCFGVSRLARLCKPLPSNG